MSIGSIGGALKRRHRSHLRSARPVLETLGYSVIAAGSAEDALRLAAERALEIRLLLTDVVHGGRPTRAPATPPRVKERP